MEAIIPTDSSITKRDEAHFRKSGTDLGRADGGFLKNGNRNAAKVLKEREKKGGIKEKSTGGRRRRRPDREEEDKESWRGDQR